MGIVAKENLHLLSPDGTELESIGFGTFVHVCANPNEDYAANQKELPVTTTVIADDSQALDFKAWLALDEHFRAHRAAKTRPCTPTIDAPAAILRDNSGHSQWILVSLLTP